MCFKGLELRMAINEKSNILFVNLIEQNQHLKECFDGLKILTSHVTSHA